MMENKKYEKHIFYLQLMEKVIEGKIKGYVCTEAGYKMNRLLSSIFFK